MKLEKTEHCKSCPAYEDDGRICNNGNNLKANIIFLGASPKKDIADTNNKYIAFTDWLSRFFQQLLRQIYDEDRVYLDIIPYYTHAVHCIPSKDTAETVKHCTKIVHGSLRNVKAKFIVALGVDAMRSLGITGSIKSLRGKIYTVNVNGEKYHCLPTYSPGSLFRKEDLGLVNILKSDIRRSFLYVLNKNKPTQSIQEIIKGYKVAKNVEDGIAICKYILSLAKEDDPLRLAVDTETTGLDTWREDFRILMMSFAWGEGQSAAILLNHREMLDNYQLLIPHIKAILECKNILKVFHNYKYDYKVLTLACGWSIVNVIWCTMIGEHLFDENKQGNYGLDDIVKNRVPEFYNYKEQLKKRSESIKYSEQLKQKIEGIKSDSKSLTAKIAELVAKKKTLKDKEEKKRIAAQLVDLRTNKKQNTENVKKLREAVKDAIEKEKDETFEDINVDDLLIYAAADTDCTYRIFLQHRDEAKKEDGPIVKMASAKNIKRPPTLVRLMRNISLPAARVLGVMEHEGINIDQTYLDEIIEKFNDIMHSSARKAYRILGREFNLRSGKDVESVLTMERGLKLTVRTKKDTGYKIDKDILDHFIDQDEIVKPIKEFRIAAKTCNDLKKLKELSAVDGRIHCNFNQTGTATGRLSSSKPNMQNIPSKVMGINIKKIFIPDNEDEVFVNMDYSGAEIRVLTVYAEDEGLIKTLNDGLGIHSYVASQIFGVPYDELENRAKYFDTDPDKYAYLDNLRQIAKRTVFLTIYGGGAATLYAYLVGEDPTITMERCEEIIQKFLSEFPIIKKYMRNVEMRIDTHGYLSTKFGRKRRFPLSGLHYRQRYASYREGINFPIQSTSSELVIDRIVDMYEHRHEIGLKPRLTVHDSFGFSMPRKNVDKALIYLDKWAQDRISSKYAWMRVPFVYEAEWGPSYGECRQKIK